MQSGRGNHSTTRPIILNRHYLWVYEFTQATYQAAPLDVPPSSDAVTTQQKLSVSAKSNVFPSGEHVICDAWNLSLGMATASQYCVSFSDQQYTEL